MTGNALLSRAEVLDRLRAYAAERGVVTANWLIANDRRVYVGVLAHFVAFEGLRRRSGAATIPVEMVEGSVIKELRRIHLAGRVRITVPGLEAAGHRALLNAIYTVVGSIRRARRLALIPEPGTRPTDGFERWDEDRVVSEIRERHRNGEPIASSKCRRSSCLRRAGIAEVGRLRSSSLASTIKRSCFTTADREEVLAEVKRAAEECSATALVCPCRGSSSQSSRDRDAVRQSHRGAACRRHRTRERIAGRGPRIS